MMSKMKKLKKKWELCENGGEPFGAKGRVKILQGFQQGVQANVADKIWGLFGFIKLYLPVSIQDSTVLVYEVPRIHWPSIGYITLPKPIPS